MKMHSQPLSGALHSWTQPPDPEKKIDPWLLTQPFITSLLGILVLTFKQGLISGPPYAEIIPSQHDYIVALPGDVQLRQRRYETVMV